MEKEQKVSQLEKDEKQKQDALDSKVIGFSFVGMCIGMIYVILDSFGVF